MISHGNVILVRHAAVDAAYHGICYGRADIPLSAAGIRVSQRLAQSIPALEGATIFHSGLERTRVLADQLAARLAGKPVAYEALRERDFGIWELQAWDAIHDSGEEIARMVTEPDTFRPGGGETTAELQRRVVRWFRSINRAHPVIAVTHGGPIAALLGAQQQLPVADWVRLIPACGTWTSLSTPRE